jgi:hypothetical protein
VQTLVEFCSSEHLGEFAVAFIAIVSSLGQFGARQACLVDLGFSGLNRSDR